MRRLDTLKHMTTDQLWAQRREMDYVRRDVHSPDHVKHAAAVLMNFYGAEIDARMSERACREES